MYTAAVCKQLVYRARVRPVASCAYAHMAYAHCYRYLSQLHPTLQLQVQRPFQPVQAKAYVYIYEYAYTAHVSSSNVCKLVTARHRTYAQLQAQALVHVEQVSRRNVYRCPMSA